MLSNIDLRSAICKIFCALFYKSNAACYNWLTLLNHCSRRRPRCIHRGSGIPGYGRSKKDDVLKPITIKSVQLHTVLLPYLRPFETSFGVESHKVAVLVELATETGVLGWGECSIELWPGYGHETAETAIHILSQFIAPAVIGETSRKADRFPGADTAFPRQSSRACRAGSGGLGCLCQEKRPATDGLFRSLCAGRPRIGRAGDSGRQHWYSGIAGCDCGGRSQTPGAGLLSYQAENQARLGYRSGAGRTRRVSQYPADAGRQQRL